MLMNVTSRNRISVPSTHCAQTTKARIRVNAAAVSQEMEHNVQVITTVYYNM